MMTGGAFLKTCGRFAAVTPPVMTLLLSTSLTSKAIARSGGLHGTTQNDKGQSFFDNDRSPAGPGGSSGGSSGVVVHLAVALQDLLVSEGRPVVAGPVVEAEAGAEAPARGPSQLAAALESKAQMVGSIAQTKRTRKSARPIVPKRVL